jgi:large subunit ribosomal protein L36
MNILTRELVNKTIQTAKFIQNNINYSTLIRTNILSANKCIKKCESQQNSIKSNNQSVALINLTQTRDYKVKTRLRKRCKHCYFVWRNGRLYVECPEHPRHKQHHVDSFLKGYDNIPNGYNSKEPMSSPYSPSF